MDNASSKTIGALNGIPFENIIGGPLSACINAQAEAAVSTVNFIESVGLKSTDDGKEAVYVVFTYVQNGRKVNISVPLLTIVPIPYIAINNINLDFKVAVTGTDHSVNEDETTVNVDRNIKSTSSKGFGILTKRKTSKMTTNISTKKDSKATQESNFSIEATMDVRVQASQESMPAGMAKVLELLGSAMDVVPEKGELVLEGPYEDTDKEPAVQYIIARYKTPEGLYEPALIRCGSDDGKVVQDGTAKRFDFAKSVTGKQTVNAMVKGDDGKAGQEVALSREIEL